MRKPHLVYPMLLIFAVPAFAQEAVEVSPSLVTPVLIARGFADLNQDGEVTDADLQSIDDEALQKLFKVLCDHAAREHVLFEQASLERERLHFVGLLRALVSQAAELSEVDTLCLLHWKGANHGGTWKIIVPEQLKRLRSGKAGFYLDTTTQRWRYSNNIVIPKSVVGDQYLA